MSTRILVCTGVGLGRWCVVMLAAAAGIAGCSSASGPLPLATAAIPTEHLVFTGAVSGTLRQGSSALAFGSAQPSSGHTQCSSFDVQADDMDFGDTYEVQLVGTVGASPVTLVVTIDNGAPSTGTVSFVNNAQDGAMATFTASGVDLAVPVPGTSSITFAADRRSGSIDLELTDAPGSTVLHEAIAGQWSCPES